MDQIAIITNIYIFMTAATISYLLGLYLMMFALTGSMIDDHRLRLLSFYAGITFIVLTTVFVIIRILS